MLARGSKQPHESNDSALSRKIFATIVAAGAHTATATGIHRSLALCRLSCAVPVISPVVGASVCAVAGAIAASVSSLTAGSGTCTSEQLVGASLAAVTTYALLAGRFSSLLPSNVAKPGAFAARSIPAPGQAYATESEKRSLIQIYYRSGCHSCGTKSTQQTCIADHLPPNKQVHGSKLLTQTLERLGGDKAGFFGVLRRARAHAIATNKPLASIKALLPRPKQRFYPQCGDCATIQAHAVRTGTTRLVTHHAPLGWRSSTSGVSAASNVMNVTRASSSQKER